MKRKFHVLIMLIMNFAAIQCSDSIQTKNDTDENKHSSKVIFGELILAKNNSEFDLWRISPKREVLLNQDNSDKLNSIINSLNKGELDAPFVGYKKYIIIPERNIIIGIYNEDHGLNIWNCSQDEYGYMQVGQAILCGDLVKVNLIEGIFSGK